MGYHHFINLEINYLLCAVTLKVYKIYRMNYKNSH